MFGNRRLGVRSSKDYNVETYIASKISRTLEYDFKIKQGVNGVHVSCNFRQLKFFDTKHTVEYPVPGFRVTRHGPWNIR